MGRSKDVLINFLVNDKAARAGLRNVAGEVGKTQSKFKQLSGGAQALVGGFAALAATKVVSFLADATQNAIADQAAQRQLALALKNTVGATDAQVAATEEWIDKTQRQTGIVDDELRPALGDLVRATGDVDKAQRDMGVAMDIATAKGLPLETVVRAMAKAANGNVGAMGRLGLTVRDTGGAFLEYDEVLQEANKTMGGATAVAAAGAEGQIKRFKIAVDEAKESLGEFIIEGLGRAAEGAQIVGRTAFEFDEAKRAIGRFEEATGLAADSAKAIVTILKENSVTFEQLAPHISLSTEELLKLRNADDELLESLGLAPDVIADMRSSLEGELVDATQAARDKGMHPLKESVEDTTTAMEEFEEEVRSQVDPIFNLIDAVNDLDDAQRDSTTARDKYGEGSPEHREALRQEAEKWLDVKDAQIRAAEEAGLTRAAFKKVLEDMRIFTSDEIALILDDFDRVNDYHFADKHINVTSDRPLRPRSGNVSSFHGGGLVGEGLAAGTEVDARLQAGETVIPIGGRTGAGAGVVQYITNYAVTARTLREQQELARRGAG